MTRYYFFSPLSPLPSPFPSLPSSLLSLPTLLPAALTPEELVSFIFIRILTGRDVSEEWESWSRGGGKRD
jgi:hypothetical protein